MNTERMLTVHEVAILLRLSDGAVYAIIRAGELRATRIGPSGRTIRIHPDELRRYQTPEAPRPVTVAARPEKRPATIIPRMGTGIRVQR